MANVSQWDTTAANNNSASPDGAPEGMSPAGVNDTIRENMAAIARIYGDWDGSLVTGGTTTAYTLTTNNSHAALTDQSLILFRVNAANTGACTLNVDSLGAKSMKLHSNDLSAGDLKADEIIGAVYNSTNDVYDIWLPLTVPQGLDTTDSPTFAGLTLTDALTYANGGYMAGSDDSIKGLELSNNSTDSDHDIDVTAGSCLDADRDTLITLAAFTKRIDATWSAGSGNGGLSSSLTAPANTTWYHVFAVIVGGAADVLFDTSVTCANGVTDHSVTQYRRLGSVLTDGSANIIAFQQNGPYFHWISPVEDVNTLNPGAVAVTPAMSVPLGVKVRGNFTTRTRDGTSISVILSDPDQADTAPSSSVYSTRSEGGVSAITAFANLDCMTDTSSQIRYHLSYSDANTEFDIVTQGWEDFRL